MYSCWDEKNELIWDNVLDKLSELGPIFPCNANDIEILSTPTEFYQCLIEEASNANDRILISTLYIGQGEREKNLINTIKNSLKNNENLKVSMIMDCSRSTRNMDKNLSSLHTLLPLFDNHNNNPNVNIHLFRTPNLKGIWNYFPERSKEIVGVHHIKAFIFDDTLIISGANLNETYLNNRQDRYFIFKNNKKLTNHIYSMISKLSYYCPTVDYNQQLKNFNINMDINKKRYEFKTDNTACLKHDIQINVENEPQKWIDFVSSQLFKFVRPNKEYDDNNNNNNDTYVVIGTQMMNKIETDSQITSFILSIPNVNIKIGTAYFNLADKYNKILLNTYSNIYKKQNGSLQILTASQKSNSFYKAKGFAGYVTPLYQYFAKQFEENINNIHHIETNHNLKRQNLFKFYRYNRPKWTYHGKGIWIDFDKNEDPFSLTMIGSSNYGQRSVHRDSEMNFTVLTKNKSLRQRLNQEWTNLTQYTDKTQSAQKSEESTPFFVGFMSGLVRNFM